MGQWFGQLGWVNGLESWTESWVCTIGYGMTIGINSQ